MIINVAFKPWPGNEMAGEGFLHWLIEFSDKLKEPYNIYLMGYCGVRRCWLDKDLVPAQPQLIVEAGIMGAIVVSSPATHSIGIFPIGMSKAEFMSSIYTNLTVMGIQLELIS